MWNVLFVFKRLCKIKYDNVLSIFSNNKYQNDKLVHNFVSNFFKFPKFMNCFKNECCNKKCMHQNFSSVCCNINHKCIMIQQCKRNKS